MTENVSDAYLQEVCARVSAATPGPWFAVRRDDDSCMSQLLVATVASLPDHNGYHGDTFHGGRSAEPAIVAGTLVQRPLAISHEAQKWEADAKFIAEARTDVEKLLLEVVRLRAILQHQYDHPTVSQKGYDIFKAGLDKGTREQIDREIAGGFGDATKAYKGGEKAMEGDHFRHPSIEYVLVAWKIKNDGRDIINAGWPNGLWFTRECTLVKRGEPV